MKQDVEGVKVEVCHTLLCCSVRRFGGVLSLGINYSSLLNRYIWFDTWDIGVRH